MLTAHRDFLSYNSKKFHHVDIDELSSYTQSGIHKESRYKPKKNRIFYHYTSNNSMDVKYIINKNNSFIDLEWHQSTLGNAIIWHTQSPTEIGALRNSQEKYTFNSSQMDIKRLWPPLWLMNIKWCENERTFSNHVHIVPLTSLSCFHYYLMQLYDFLFPLAHIDKYLPRNNIWRFTLSLTK